VEDDPGTEPGPGGVEDPAVRARRTDALLAGHTGDIPEARRALSDPAAAVRAAALGALDRAGGLERGELEAALADPAPEVRRRALRVAAAALAPPAPPQERGERGTLLALVRAGLGDPDALVVEEACWALGEAGDRGGVTGLSTVAGAHRDTRCREAAVAALGAIGDLAGLPAVLAATTDKATVRRRAVVALAAFDGPEVEAAIERARADRDWQVREVADILGDD
jgi:HEAT repeat protein